MDQTLEHTVVPQSPPLGQAVVALNPTTSYAYVLAHTRYLILTPT